MKLDATSLRAPSDQPEGRPTTTKVMRMSLRYEEFKRDRPGGPRETRQLHFTGVDEHDVYNITAPFVSAGHTVIAGRVEPRDHEYSKIVFFEEKDGLWHPIPRSLLFDLQDPFFCFIGDELVFGGVRVHETDSGLLGWRTVFFRGSNIYDLTEFFVGPDGMKDIRFCDLKNGQIAVFTRPQGAKGGRGTIGYTEIGSLDELSLEILESAPLIENMFDPADWGGVNETHLLPNDEIGVLAHAAYYENDDRFGARHYHAISFIFSPLDRTFKDFKIIATRDQFPDGHAKRADLQDVIFSSGLARGLEGTKLYAGLSDAEAHWMLIPDPFL